jgi:tetratricopeptide (TPR) repeat protein
VVDGGLEAIAADRPDLAASAFANLVHMDGLLRGEEFSRHWGDLAEAMLARLGTTTQYHTSLASARAYMTLQSGQIEDAVAAHEHVLELAEATLGPDNHHTLGTREALAHLLSSIGENERALPLAEGTLARQRELFGETSRDVATSLGTVANVLTAMLRGYEAVPYHERSIAIMRELYGDADLEVGNALTHFAATLLHIDQPRRALEVLEEARPIARELSGRGPTHAAYVERLTGDALAALGELEQARDIWLAALAEPNTRIPPPMRIMLEVHLANALRRLGDPKAALDHAQAAGQVAAETYGTDHFLTALGEVEQTMASVANGAEDLAPLERLAQDDAGEYAPRARFYLAQALMARGRDTDRAYALAVQAHVEALRVEPLLAREIAAWQPTR